ncbi:MAG: 4Fe-4S dicluster domain-containing protein [Deltaproteobacteria bacterium]|nr:4Fe-4S dicluster domain-containing protein [Deltaproteobacteria bacterium]
MSRYGLAIDVDRCTGCYACLVACKSENSTAPGVFWIRIEEKEAGEYPDVSRNYIPMLCMQCGEMPCAQGCPTDAISRDSTGVIIIDPEKCICETTKPCTAACPFGVLTANDGKKSYFPDYLTPFEKEASAAHPQGVVEKCDLCYQRITSGRLPACVQTCPTQAIIFGDLEERESNLARLVFGGNAEALNPEPKVDPSVFYIKRRKIH